MRAKKKGRTAQESSGGPAPAQKLEPQGRELGDGHDLSEGQFRLAFDNAPIGMAIVGLDYHLQRVNKSLCEALGYSERELLARSLDEITHPDDITRDRELADKLFRGEIPSYRLEKRFTTKDGRLVWLDLTAVVIHGVKQKPVYGLAMVENITERKASEEALRTSEERYRSFVSNGSEGIWRLEAERPIDISLPIDEQIELFHRFIYLAECNDAIARMYGYRRADDMLGSRLSDLLTFSDPTNLSSLQAFITNGYRLHNLESVEEDSEGRKKYFSSNVIGIVINGFLLRVWGTQRDVTERRVAEDGIKRSRQQMRALAARLQSLREKERADIAREMHDVLGQGLTGLKIDLAALAKSLPESTKESASGGTAAEKLRSATRLLDETINAVKVLSTELRPGVLDKFGLPAAVEWQCQEFERRNAITCECHLADEDVSLETERSTALFRILQEALTNVARHARAEHVVVELKAHERTLCLSVQDDGQGITGDEISNPASLGLLGMRERAEMSGGEFTVEGEPGRGTIVKAQMPLGETEQ